MVQFCGNCHKVGSARGGSAAFDLAKAAAVAVVYGLLISIFYYKDLTFGDIPELLLSSFQTSAVVLLVIGATGCLSWLMTVEQVATQLAAWVQSVAHQQWVFLLLTNVALLLLGTFIEPLPALLYDEVLVRKALHNLLLNAQEAGAARVRLEARAAPRGWQLVLEDDGPGIAPEDLEHVFEPYFTRKPEGTGLGLAIVYKICTDHGWSVTARSPGGSRLAEAADRPGTAFVISIPSRAAAPA